MDVLWRCFDFSLKKLISHNFTYCRETDFFLITGHVSCISRHHLRNFVLSSSLNIIISVHQFSFLCLPLLHECNDDSIWWSFFYKVSRLSTGGTCSTTWYCYMYPGIVIQLGYSINPLFVIYSWVWHTLRQLLFIWRQKKKESRVAAFFFLVCTAGNGNMNAVYVPHY